MKEYKFEELKAGISERFYYVVKEGSIDRFCEIYGDENPLHTDSGYAKNNGFKDAVVHGMNVSCLISTLVGMHIPGKYSVLMSVRSDFKAPVYEGDMLTVTGEVVFLVPVTRVVKICVKIINQEGEVVVEAEAMVKMLR